MSRLCRPINRKILYAVFVAIAIIGLVAIGIVVYIGATEEEEIEPVYDPCEDSWKSLNRYTPEAATISEYICVPVAQTKFYE